MDASIASFLQNPFLRTLRQASASLDLQCYVVGGCLRDLLMGRGVNDVDIAVGGGPEALSRRFAKECGGTFFWLDQERGHSRVVIKGGAGIDTFDFAPLRGEDICADLALRDFTINSLAVPLQGGVELFDPLKGETDIRAQLVRRCAESVFRDDPLRLVRAFRFAATLGFRIETETLAAITTHAPLIANSAGERIRDELFQVLCMPGTGSVFRTMGDAGLLCVLFGLSPSQVYPAAEAMDRVEAVVQSLSQLGDETAEKGCLRLQEQIQGGMTVLSLTKLAAFLTVTEADLPAAADRLKLGKTAGQLVEKLCRADTLALAERLDTVSAYTLFNACDPAGLELPLLLLARGHITESRCRELARYYLHCHIPRGGNLLLSGAEIMELLSVPPCKMVGDAHELLREAQCTGQVRTGAEASVFLRKKLLTTNEPMG
ncbi:Polynucleotide adenylyltransferase region [Geobacter metallireducens RCH3]|uniref:Cytidine-specific tRNA nucleotidyltransferase n=1 Tax=Geobacter metallireducens (strain ATCC 53774 / DSM 7210 / GS-15) TaxID=269799 RepID=Q39TB4_GEOMG|nr:MULTISPECIES: CCA tRNA nucleotidyltransferase [Geobacter]ABB32510.1 cytidine-specific tRNA nucleotidyltransferase [Geobacter metallireducens GS-15]EHP84367.1 Polynucleotide adenylyltransferase region [Geobacter metallireducens RCH3]MBT1076045.1 CCA tRNA nucleotidyltransferase [Geobacter grbiciae]